MYDRLALGAVLLILLASIMFAMAAVHFGGVPSCSDVQKIRIGSLVVAGC